MVGLVDEAEDGGLQLGDGSKDAAFETSARELGGEALDRIEPGSRTCWPSRPDVTDEAQAEEAVAQALERFGWIDVLRMHIAGWAFPPKTGIALSTFCVPL